MMKALGVLLVVLGVVFGVYVGVYLMFIGGIVQIVETVKGDISGMQIGLGLLRILLSPATGWIGVFAVSGFGTALIRSSK